MAAVVRHCMANVMDYPANGRTVHVCRNCLVYARTANGRTDVGGNGMTIKHDSGVRYTPPWNELPRSKDKEAYQRYFTFCEERGIAAMSFDQWRINDSGMTARGSFAW